MNDNLPITPQEQAEIELTRLLVEQRNPRAAKDIETISTQVKILSNSIFRNRKSQVKSDASQH